MVDTATDTPSRASGPSWKFIIAMLVVVLPFVCLVVVPRIIRAIGIAAGWMLRNKTNNRRTQLVELMDKEDHNYTKTSPGSGSTSSGGWDMVQETDVDKISHLDRRDQDWSGIVGFFHPFCNAGGGGERVLWAAINATQSRWPRAKCVVYTGDHNVTKEQILHRVKTRFNIHLHPPTVQFLYLSSRHWVLSSTWPRFTLLGQSVGSMILAWDAFSLLVPDIFIDTMGYAFALGFCHFLFPNVPTGAYVHYPTISTDMLESLDPSGVTGSQGVNAGQGVGLRGSAKTVYWKIFAKAYSWMGASIGVVMVNSTWTRNHIEQLWGPYRSNKDKHYPIKAVYPPCAVEEMEKEVEVSETSEKSRQPIIVCIAQFRPEKNHTLIIESFAKFVKTGTRAASEARLVLIGSVRDDYDSKRVYQLRLLVNELHIRDRVEFCLDAPWPNVLAWLRKASVGVNAMWNEHFGIGVVEYQAAGLISVVHNSGGPKLDIVVEIDGQPTGFLATTADEFAAGYENALSIPNPLDFRIRARKSAKRFTEEVFRRDWLSAVERLVAMVK